MYALLAEIHYVEQVGLKQDLTASDSQVLGCMHYRTQQPNRTKSYNNNNNLRGIEAGNRVTGKKSHVSKLN